MKFNTLRRNRIWMLTGALMVLLLLCAGPAIAESGGHGESHTTGWIATDTYRVVNFAILVIALFILLRKPLTNALNSRIKGIQDQLTDLEAQKTAAEKMLAEYNERLARLDDEAQKIVDEYIQQGNDAKARIIAAAKESAVKLEEQARRNIENEFHRARKELQAEIIEKALIKAEEIIHSKITGEDQNRLVDEYLDKVVA